MRIVSEHIASEVLTVIDAVRSNRESWKDWKCVKFEMLSHGTPVRWAGLHASIRKLIGIYLEDKHGTAYLAGHSDIHVFCKDISLTLLHTMGMQIEELVRTGASVAVMYRIYDLFEDHAGFLNACDERKAAEERNPEHAAHSDLPFLPQEPARGTDSLSSINGCKVLLVEDDPVTRWMVKMALKDSCRLSVAPDANKALAAYQHTRPDMVLLDINLPGRSGTDVMEHIMDSDPGAHIVMFSSHDSLENMVETLGRGAKGFIPKPFNKDRLISCVRSCHGGR